MYEYNFQRILNMLMTVGQQIYVVKNKSVCFTSFIFINAEHLTPILIMTKWDRCFKAIEGQHIQTPGLIYFSSSTHIRYS